MKNKYWLPLIVAVSVVVGIILGWLLNNTNRHYNSNMGKLEQVLELINDKYVDEIDIDSLVEMTIPQLLHNLDPHSSYVSAADYVRATSELEGSFSGVGISFQIFNDTLTVVEVISGGPAEKVGVMPGDRIIKVDDKDIAGTGITEDDVFSLLRGVKGTKVTLGIKRNNSKKPLEFIVTRDDIPVESIDAAYMLDNTTGYVRVSRFARHTYEEFRQALNKLRLQGATSFVVDLRGNGGGYMEPAILMANEFLPAGREIIATKGRDYRDNQNWLSDGSGAFQDFGLVVMIDEFSASASEIFSGAIQDNDRGWIVGRRSFGKGLVQQPIMLPDSSEIRLTISRYYTPSGRSIQKKYTPGLNNDYDKELINRFNSGEMQSADSVKLNLDQAFKTVGGRTVYGGGGIMPDFFVPDDTTMVTSYYIAVANAGLPMKYAYEYVDHNRKYLGQAKDLKQLMSMMPSDEDLLQDFADFAARNGVPARWYYINISAPRIVNQLKALIARNMLGMGSYWEVINSGDPYITNALKHTNKKILKK